MILSTQTAIVGKTHSIGVNFVSNTSQSDEPDNVIPIGSMSKRNWKNMFKIRDLRPELDGKLSDINCSLAWDYTGKPSRGCELGELLYPDLNFSCQRSVNVHLNMGLDEARDTFYR